MTPLDSLLRTNNLKLFFNLAEYVTTKNAALDAGMTQQHGTRLVKLWSEAGWIEQRPSSGRRYYYTPKGLEMRNKLLVLREFL